MFGFLVPVFVVHSEDGSPKRVVSSLRKLGFNILRGDYTYSSKTRNFVVRFCGAYFGKEIGCFCSMTDAKMEKLLEAYDFPNRYKSVSFSPNKLYVPKAMSRSEFEEALRAIQREGKEWKRLTWEEQERNLCRPVASDKIWNRVEECLKDKSITEKLMTDEIITGETLQRLGNLSQRSRMN